MRILRSLAALGAPSIAVCALAGALAGAGGVTVYTSEAASYLSNDPRACINCHVMRDHYDGWQKASHHAQATCNDCHTPQATLPKLLSKMENGYRHSKGFTFQDFHEPIRIRPSNSTVLERNCLRCHGEFVAEITAHGPAEGGFHGCVRCHGSVGHGPTR
jgi:cytochrome c nitrite reductase small subunit